MKPVTETRRERLAQLKKRFKRWSDFNQAIGWEATSTRLSQIYNKAIRSDRGTAFVMGDATARHIEQALGLEVGWMDTPAENEYTESNVIERANAALGVMEPEMQYMALRMIEAMIDSESTARTKK